jgi:hypothetical protein
MGLFSRKTKYNVVVGAPEIVGKIALGIDLGEQPRWG